MARTDRHRDIDPEDGQARVVLAAQLQMIRKATATPLRTTRKTIDLAAREAASDWTVRQVQRWANFFNSDFILTFEGFDLDGIDFQVRGEGDDFVKDFREKVYAIRTALGIRQAEMDRRLRQTRSYGLWERRSVDDVWLSAAQRIVRAMGGKLKISITHRFNAGINKKISN